MTDQEIIDDLRDQLEKANSFIRMQELEMEWRIEEEIEKKTSAMYDKGYSDAIKMRGAKHEEMHKRVVKGLEHELRDWLPGALDRAIPDQYKRVITKPMKDLAPSVSVNYYTDRATHDTNITAQIEFPSRVMRINYCV